MLIQTAGDMVTYIRNEFKRTDKDDLLYECMSDTVLDMTRRLETAGFSNETTSIFLGGILSDFQIGTPGDFKFILTAERILGNILCIDTDDSWNLERVSKDKFEKLYPHTQGSGVITGPPEHFATFGTYNYVYIGPVPDKVGYQYRVKYVPYTGTDSTIWKLPLTATESVYDVPYSDKYRDVIRDGTLMRAYKSLNNFAMSGQYDEHYEFGILKIINREYLEKQSTGQVAYSDC